MELNTTSSNGGGGEVTGPAAATSTSDVALHEAAHAVAAIVHGRGVDRVTIAGRADLTWACDDPRTPLGEVVADLVVLLVPAEVAKRSWTRTGDAVDGPLARDAARRYTATDYEAETLVEHARAKAVTLCHDRRFADAVERVADALADRGSLDGDDVDRIINQNGGANGET